MAEWVLKLIEETNRAAIAMLSNATEMTIIGYPFHRLNQARLDALLSHAQDCRVIELHDVSEETHLRLKALVARLGLRTEVL